MDVIINTISGRIKEARKDRGLSREKLIAEINEDFDRPLDKEGKPKTLEFETFRRWEDGTNAVTVKWIPVLCKHLRCDVGYLFGEYEEFTRHHTDVCDATGLSSDAVKSLIGIKKLWAYIVI